MAHDSDIDSWELRQPDLSSNRFCRNDTKIPAAIPYVTNEFRDREIQVDSAFNDCSRFQPRTRFSRSGSDVRFVNPSIYNESPESNKFSAKRSIVRGNCGDSEALTGDLSSLSIYESSNLHDHAGDRRNNGRDTYRCQRLASPTTPSTLLSSSSSRANSKSSVRVVCCTIGKSENIEETKDLTEQPEVQRYALNGTRVVEYSASSTNLSDRGGSTSRVIQGNKRAYEEWVEKKRAAESRIREEKRRIEQEKLTEDNRLAKEREERERRERENFLQWNERKRKEEASKRESMERELEFERRLKEVEEKAVVAKTIYLRQWARKKEEQQKALQRKQEVRKKRDDEERKKRLEESEKAYVKWRETSKNRPRPATQGLLPHQKATPSYINPNPWVADNDEPGEMTKKQSSGELKKMGISEAGSSVRKSIVSKQ